MALSNASRDSLLADYLRHMEEARVIRDFLARNGVPVRPLGVFKITPKPGARGNPKTAVRGSPSGHTGLRQRILGALQEHPRRLRPRDVSALLKAGGYEDHAATPLAARVSSELNRLHHEGKVEKREGKYRLKPGEGQLSLVNGNGQEQ